MDPDKASQQIGQTEVKGCYDLIKSLRLFQLAISFPSCSDCDDEGDDHSKFIGSYNQPLY